MYVVFFLYQYSDCRGRNLKLNHNSDVYENQLSGELPASWSALPNIVSLYVLEQSNLLPSYLCNIPTRLLWSNEFTGELPASWSAMTQLKALLVFLITHLCFVNSSRRFLNDNNLSGTLPESWSEMSSLQVLCV